MECRGAAAEAGMVTTSGRFLSRVHDQTVCKLLPPTCCAARSSAGEKSGSSCSPLKSSSADFSCGSGWQQGGSREV